MITVTHTSIEAARKLYAQQRLKRAVPAVVIDADLLFPRAPRTPTPKEPKPKEPTT